MPACRRRRGSPSVDPRLVSAVDISSAQLNYRNFSKQISRVGANRTGSVFQTQWRAPVRLAVDDVLDVYLKIATVVPDNQLTGVKHPVIAVVASGATASQRLTGRETLTRTYTVRANTADG